VGSTPLTLASAHKVHQHRADLHMRIALHAPASAPGLGFSAGVGANVVRVLRIGRVLRLVGRAKTLNRLFNTLMLSLPSVWNIGSLLFVLLFIYSVLGMQLWGKVVYSEGGLSPQANFRTFPRALLTMFR